MVLPTRRIIVIYGPTGVGKSSFALQLAQKINGEVVNADMGQLYTPLTIGTAKPDWQHQQVKHHLFDVINEPVDCTVILYRQMVQDVLNGIWQREHTPIIVGGSGFYIHSLFFPPQKGSGSMQSNGEVSWDVLNKIDPVRAKAIHPNDTYRISRALAIWYATGIVPSQMRQPYEPFASYDLLYLTRERTELSTINNQRTITMINEGWLEECGRLVELGWEPFIRRKKLIGYCELFDCIAGTLPLESAIPIIQRKTRQYAKRQETFWRMLARSLNSSWVIPSAISGSITELNLTLTEQALYINQLSEKLNVT